MRALSLALLLAACHAQPAAPAAALPPPARGAAHADPATPFALEVNARALSATEAELTVRATPAVTAPTLRLGVDLGQAVSVVDGLAERTVQGAPGGVAVELKVRVRRVTQGATGVVLRAWAEARGEGVLYGDERAVTVFGRAPDEKRAVERSVVTPAGEALHDTLVE